MRKLTDEKKQFAESRKKKNQTQNRKGWYERAGSEHQTSEI